MAEEGTPPERTTKAPKSAIQGCGAGCLTLIVGVFVSWCAAEYAVRHRPDRMEVSDALCWEFLWFEWCCGGSLVVLFLAVFVGAPG